MKRSSASSCFFAFHPRQWEHLHRDTGVAGEVVVVGGGGGGGRRVSVVKWWEGLGEGKGGVEEEEREKKERKALSREDHYHSGICPLNIRPVSLA